MGNDSSSESRRLIDEVLPTGGSGGEPLDEDTVFDILSNRRRRRIIYYLKEHGGSAELRDLADVVAAWEEEMPVEEVTEKQSRRVYVSLYQSHVPRLAEVGLVRHDDSGRVTLTDRVRKLDPYLDPHGDDDRFEFYYLGLGLIGFLLGALFVLGVVPTTLVSGGTALLVVSFGLVLLSLAQVQRSGRFDGLSGPGSDE
jgi:DNA-binding transcriptional ArsR family regulator